MNAEMTPASASVSTSDKGVDLVGSLVYSTVASILSEGGKHLENHQADSISINLSKLERIDSAGITLLLDWKRLCDKQNKKFQVVGAQAQATSLITTNKMQGVLNLI